MTVFDTGVAIVGAGAAGLAAARALRAGGLDAITLEARSRVGGRAYTVAPYDASFPIELGAEFIHGEPESTAMLLRECGHAAIDQLWNAYEFRDGRLRESGEAWEATQRLLERMPTHGNDRSIDEFLETLRGDVDARTLDSVRTLVEGFDAAITSDASAIAIAKEWQGAYDRSQARPSGGYTPLLECLARTSGRIMLDTRVREIAWSRGGVRIDAERYGERIEVRARRAIVTLPIGVLRENRVAFDPPLPQRTREAIGAIAMGPVVKVMLHFRTPFWEKLDDERYRDLAFVQTPQTAFGVLWTRAPERDPLLAAWSGGGSAQRFIERRLDPVAEALDLCARIFPEVDVRHELVAAYHHDWQIDPYACGAYSYLRTGGGDARTILAEPIEQALFFAGEATSADDSGTVGGALDSGYRAAREVLTARV